MSTIDITAIVNGHREGLLAHPTLLSLTQAVTYAERRGLRVEILLVLDRADRITTDVFEAYAKGKKDARTVVVDHGDLGRSRNSGVVAARGEWLAFLDADDLWGENWLSAAHSAAKSDTRSIVWHPAISVYFGPNCHIFRHVDAEDPEYSDIGLAITNYWTALCFARRVLLLEHPYPDTDLQRQIGFEDWAWNMKVIAAGTLHKIVASTGHAIRTKEVSLLKQTTAAGCLPYPSGLFRKILEERRPPQMARSPDAATVGQ